MKKKLLKIFEHFVEVACEDLAIAYLIEFGWWS